MTKPILKISAAILFYCLFPIGYSVVYWLAERSSVHAWACYLFTVIAYAIATVVPFAATHPRKGIYAAPVLRLFCRLSAIMCLALFMILASMNVLSSRMLYVTLIVAGMGAVYSLLY